jgi:hypothetical protein
MWSLTMSVDVSQAKSIFLAVLEKPLQEQAAFLDSQCGTDRELRQRVEGMLQAHALSGELLPRSAAEMLDSAGVVGADATSAADSPAHPREGAGEDLGFLKAPTRAGAMGRLGHYEVLKVIGKGGFGIVLRAFDEKLHRMVAIKVLAPAYANNGAARKRFIREARASAAVKNEHVVGIYDVQEEANPPYLVMELIDGVSLEQKLERHGPLEIKEILRIGMQMAEGLAAAHKQGLVHRDIKPANILLENGVERVKITDFGLARAVDDASVTQSGTVAGTPMYMSPEQAEGLSVDHRSDLFSLGSVLYAMCTGHPPFRATGTHAVLKRVIDAAPRPLREINAEMPDWLESIVAKLHAKKPDDRLQTAGEVAELLGQHLAYLQQPGQVKRPAPVANAVALGGQHLLPWPAVAACFWGATCIILLVFVDLPLSQGVELPWIWWFVVSAALFFLAWIMTMVRHPTSVSRRGRRWQAALVLFLALVGIVAAVMHWREPEAPQDALALPAMETMHHGPG